VLAPTVGARPCLIMGEVVPRIASCAVILPHRPPLPLAEIRTPFLPRDVLLTCFFQAFLFGVHVQPYFPLRRYTEAAQTSCVISNKNSSSTVFFRASILLRKRT